MSGDTCVRRSLRTATKWQSTLVHSSLTKWACELSIIKSLSRESITSIEMDRQKLLVNSIADIRKSQMHQSNLLILKTYWVLLRKWNRLPVGCDPDRVTSELSSDGYLTVKAPKQRFLVESKRVVPIKHTYRPCRAILDWKSNLLTSEKIRSTNKSINSHSLNQNVR